MPRSLGAASSAMTLWAFLGVLMLPTPSRASVIAVDLAAAAEVGELPMRMAIERLDRWEDDKPVRSRAIVHCNVGRPALWVMLPGD